VAFTVDPRSGAGAHIIIEAVHGLGPAAVEGRAAPARFVVDKRTLEVVEHTPGRQDQVLVASASSGAAWQAADPDRHGRPAATAGQIRTVARLAREIEAGLGAPQDIEWCAEDDRVWIVQARPLTVRRSSWASRQVWSNLNAGEVLPGVITPLTWSLVCAIQPMLRRLFRRAGVDLGAHPLVGRIGGRLYFNLNTITAVAVRFPGGKTQSFSQAFGGAHLNGGVGPIPPQDLPRIKGGLARLCAQMPAFLLWLLQHRAAVADRCLRRLERRRKQLEQRDLSARTDVVLVAELQRFLDALFDDHLLVYPVVGLGCFMLLKELCGRWFDEPSLANSLLTGSGGISSADAGLALWDVAGLAVGDELVLRELLQPGDFRQVRGRLESHAAGRDFLARWDAFMREHGHHCKGEIELRNPRWREQPDVILEMVRSYAAMLPQKNAAAEYRSRARARRRRARRCREALRNPFSRALFRGLLSSARKGMSVRETIKSEVVRHLAAVRSLVLELGRRWAACGRLAEADDAFFLELAELPLVAAGDPRFDARAAVAARRREFDHQQTLSAPPVVVGQDLPAPAPPGADAAPGQILRGLAVSSGQATGRARIIEHADSGGKLEAGEILVAPFTDPGWAPYFLPAAGIVVDIGGLLSHGSIVAREYGIPAVVNVGPATRTLRNGQLLHVDGDRGEVRVLEEC
jgi:pyruvate,water dikinase